MAEGRQGKIGQERLLVAAQVRLPQQPDAPVLFQRGMNIVSRDGLDAGHVAAIIVSGDPPEPQALLLDRLPTYLDYRVVSLALVSHVTVEAITLLLDARAIARLPRWRQPLAS